MKFKNLAFTNIEQLVNSENDKRIHAAWNNSLGHQINKNKLPEYKTVKRDLLSLFNNIFNNGSGTQGFSPS